MAFDGITVAALTAELKAKLAGGRINKIAQPDKDSLLITVKKDANTERLFISASASLPLAYLTEKNRVSPAVAPNFCMLLRKHIGTARILDVTQPGFERIIRIELEHLDELGDVAKKSLVIELMGKHSNIIFLNEDGKILDSIKHVSAFMSSVREVLPGRDYFIPAQEGKINPLDLTEKYFNEEIMTKNATASGALSASLTGFSKTFSFHVCAMASLDPDTHVSALTEGEKLHLFKNLERELEKIKEGAFSPAIYYADGVPAEFAPLPLKTFENAEKTGFSSVSAMLEEYYGAKDEITRIRAKTADLRKIITNLIERNVKKYDLFEKQLKDTEKKDKYKVYGELINTYGYSAAPGSKELACTNYYDGSEITILLDPDIPVMDNAKKYFDRYNKLKRTFDAVSVQIAQTKEELTHLNSILLSLDNAVTENDLAQIKKELSDFGYVKKKTGFDRKAASAEKRLTSGAKPFHYVNKDGYDIYVGKNNYQNDELTFKFANGDDWWFHAKGMAGSHVILKKKGEEIPDSAFEDAARLAAYYSSAKGQGKVEVDYVIKKEVKKPASAVPGFVVYYTNYSMMIDTDISGLTLIG